MRRYFSLGCWEGHRAPVEKPGKIDESIKGQDKACANPARAAPTDRRPRDVLRPAVGDFIVRIVGDVLRRGGEGVNGGGDGEKGGVEDGDEMDGVDR